MAAAADVLLLTAGEPYSDQWSAEWRYLYSVGKNVSNTGAFSFVPQPKQAPLAQWHMGSMRVSPSAEPDGTWYELIPKCFQFLFIHSHMYSLRVPPTEGGIEKQVLCFILFTVTP